MATAPRKPRRQTATRPQSVVVADLLRAADREHPVTIQYVAADGVATIRTVEPVEVVASASGELLLVAWCRLRGEKRTFRVSRLVAYTVHSRTGLFVVPQTDDEAPTLVFPPESDHEGTAAILADLADSAEASGEPHLAATLWARALWHWEIADEIAAAGRRWVAKRQAARADGASGESTRAATFV